MSGDESQVEINVSSEDEEDLEDIDQSKIPKALRVCRLLESCAEPSLIRMGSVCSLRTPGARALFETSLDHALAAVAALTTRSKLPL